MDYNYIAQESEAGSDFYVMSPIGYEPNQYLAPPMDRARGSRSSMGSSRSAGSNGDQNYNVLSPISSYVGSPASDEGFTRRESVYELSQNSLLSPKQAAPSREPSAELPPFDIEKEGDPRIAWFMYYDFIVTKTEAYFRLQPSYIASESYPERRDPEKVML
jgi:hypothetical protein